MIDAAFDHIVSDPQTPAETQPQAPNDMLWEDDWPEPSDGDFGANPVYDTGS